MWQLKLVVSILMVAIGLSDCAIEPESISSPDSKGALPASVDSNENDVKIVPQFDIQLLPVGQLKTGQVRLDVQVKANVAAPDFQFNFIAPDLEIAKANEWTGRRAWTEQTFPVVAEERRGLGKDQFHVQSVVLDVPSPGYYRLIATAVAEPQPQEREGELIQNVIQEEFWLWVNETAGVVTREFDKTRFSDGYLKRPGPLTGIPIRQPQRGLAPAGYDATVFQVRYVNSDSSNILTPVPNARVRYTIFDQYENRVIAQGEFTTDAIGNFAADCPYPYGWETNTYEVDAVDSYSAVQPGIPLFSVTLYPNDPYCENATNLVDVSAWARVFTNLKVVVPVSRSFLSYSRGLINVYSTGSSTAYYSPSQDRIYLPASGIWSAGGFFTIAHEYGHAVHEKVLGGLNPGWGSCPNPHFVELASTYGCALSEGFADFHAVRVWGQRSAFYNRVVALQSVSIGPMVEGAVAGFFYDLLDGSGTPGETSESHDSTQYAGSYLATILKTCTFFPPVGGSRATGLDHIVYCLERSLSSRTGHHWSDRPAVASFSEGATEPTGWSQTAIYNNWHWNIYRH